jgi:basic membrane protein A and related proteins
MRMSKNVGAICFVVVMSMMFIYSLTPTLAADKFKVAALFPGSINDATFNQSGYEGLKKIERELGAEISFIEKVPGANEEENMLDYARRGYNLIIAHGGQMDNSALKVAKRFPKVKFFVTNGGASGPNISHGGINQNHYGYVTGMLAARMTKTNKVSFISAQNFPFVVSVYEAIKKGAVATKPKVEVSAVYTGDWEDVHKAKEAAFAEIAKGSDVLFPYLNFAKLGILDAAREKDIYAFGEIASANEKEIDRQFNVAPKNTLAIVLMNYGEVLFNIAKLVKSGKFEGGKSFFLGLETPGITGFLRENKVIPKEVLEEIKKAKQDIIAGKIKF